MSGRGASWGRTAAVLIAIAGTTASLGAWELNRRIERSRNEAAFADAAYERINALSLAFEDAEETLVALDALWRASERVEPAEFRIFAMTFLRVKPHVDGLAWVQRVPFEERGAFESRTSEELGSEFRIREPDRFGRMVPADRRDEYFPIVYMAPPETAERVVGLDLGYDAARRAAIVGSAESGRMRLSEAISLVASREGETGPGVLAALPVRKEGGDADGFVVAVLRLDRLIAAAVRPLADTGIAVSILEREEDGATHLVASEAAPEEIRSDLVRDEDVDVGGRDWILRATAKRGARRTGGWGSWIALLAGLSVTTAVVAFVLAREDRATELAAANAALEREIAERRKAEAERAAMQAQILDAQKLESLGILAGGIAHDFNNILTGIVGNAELARLHLDRQHAASGPLQHVVEASERAAILTRQLLAYAGKGGMRPRPVDLSKLLHDMQSLLETSVPKKVALRVEPTPHLPPVDGDPSQLQQVVLNLVVNAGEACGEGSGTVTARTTLLPDGSCAIEVRDTGVGMDDATQARIFDPFFTTKFTGRGLGLAAVLGIVRAHRGKLRVTSQPGLGSAFVVSFPPSSSVEPEEEAAVPAAPLPSSRGVLLVDDEPMIVELSRATLEDAGYTVLEAPDGRRALEVVRRRGGEVGLVVTDLTMPEMDGEELARELHSLRPELPVVLMTGYGDEGLAERFEGLGIRAFLTKPFLPADLLGIVRRMLDGGDETL